MISRACPNCRLVVSSGETWCRNCGARLPTPSMPGGSSENYLKGIDERFLAILPVVDRS